MTHSHSSKQQFNSLALILLFSGFSRKHASAVRRSSRISVRCQTRLLPIRVHYQCTRNSELTQKTYGKSMRFSNAFNFDRSKYKRQDFKALFWGVFSRNKFFNLIA